MLLLSGPQLPGSTGIYSLSSCPGSSLSAEHILQAEMKLVGHACDPSAQEAEVRGSCPTPATPRLKSQKGPDGDFRLGGDVPRRADQGFLSERPEFQSLYSSVALWYVTVPSEVPFLPLR
jgi:hypothetical protein